MQHTAANNKKGRRKRLALCRKGVAERHTRRQSREAISNMATPAPPKSMGLRLARATGCVPEAAEGWTKNSHNAAQAGIIATAALNSAFFEQLFRAKE